MSLENIVEIPVEHTHACAHTQNSQYRSRKGNFIHDTIFKTNSKEQAYYIHIVLIDLQQ